MKIITLAVWGFVLTVQMNAQSWQWAKRSGGTGYDRCTSTSTDPLGNIFTTGSFNSPTIAFGSTILTNSGNTNQYIAKYDATGNVLWAKSVGGTSVETSFSVCADAQGNAFITGGFTSPITFGTTTLTPVGGADIYVAKYDANGNPLWAKSAGGTADEFGVCVSTAPLGGVVVTGWFQSPILTLGSITLTNGGGITFFISKYDENGNVLWAKSAKGNTNNGGCSASVDAAGNAFVTGGFDSPTMIFDSDTLTNLGNFAVFIAKYDADGHLLWAKNSIGTGSDAASSVCTDPSGNAFITGGFNSPTLTFGSISIHNSGYTDVFTVKYDANGNSLWVKGAGGTNSDGGNSIKADANGNVFVTGLFDSNQIIFDSIVLNRAAGSPDPMFIAEYNTNGHVLFASSLADGGNQNSVSIDQLSNIIVGGTFSGNHFVIGNDTLLLTGSENVFVAKFCSPPHAPIATNTTICANNTANLSAIGTGTFGWYNATIGGTHVGSGANYTSPVLTASTTYYVQDSTCGASTRTAVHVTVNPLPVATTHLTGRTIAADQNGAIYQWLDCDSSKSAIAGEMNQQFTATKNGNYAVLITLNGCSDTSACVSITAMGISTLVLDDSLRVYPNPNNGSFTLQVENKGAYSIINALGQTIQQFELKVGGNYAITIDNLPSGIYSIVEFSGMRIRTQRVVVLK